MRIWARIFKDNKMLADYVVENYDSDTRTHKVFDAIEKTSYHFDLSTPIWLDSNINEFKRHAKVRFYKDSFMDEIDFDFLELSIIEED